MMPHSFAQKGKTMEHPTASSLRYTFTFQRRFWPLKRHIQGVSAHVYSKDCDKMIIRTDFGSHHIRNWSDCEVFLGKDWQEYVNALEQLRRSAIEVGIDARKLESINTLLENKE